MKLHAITKYGKKPQEPTKLNPAKRIVHKKALRLNEVAAELDRKHPEPMSLFHKREKQGEVPGEADAAISKIRCGHAYCKPEVTAGQAEKAARAMAEWDNSDPFAYGRTFLFVKQGFLKSQEVIEEMHKRTIARRAAKIREVDNAKTGI